MSLLFNRNYRLEIEGNGVLTTITGLRIEFLCKKNRSSTANEMTVKVYNPNRDTINQSLSSGAIARLYAGYGDDIKLIAQSQITTAYPTKQGVDTILTLECLDGIENIRKTKVSISFQRGSTVKQVLNALVAYLQIPLKVAPDVDLSKQFNNGYSYAGGVGVALDEVTSRAFAKWTIQDGTLMVLGQLGTTNTTAVYLTPETGLIGIPTPVEDTVNSLEVGEIRRGYKFTSLLQGDILPSDKISIKSKYVDSEYIVESVEHKGDTHAKDWVSEVVCYDKEVKEKRTEKGKEKKKTQAINTVAEYGQFKLEEK